MRFIFMEIFWEFELLNMFLAYFQHMTILSLFNYFKVVNGKSIGLKIRRQKCDPGLGDETLRKLNL